MSALIAGRTIQGLGAGVIGSIAYIAIARGYPAELKPQMLAVLSSAWVIPGLIGPGLAAIVADTVGWRWVFLGLAPVMVGAGGLAVPSLARIGGNASAPRHWRKMLAALGVAAGAGLLLNGISTSSVLRQGVMVSGGLLLSGMSLQYLLPKGTLRVATAMPAALVAGGLLNMAFFGVDAFVPLALIEVRGQSATRAGLALTAATIMWTTGAWLQARLVANHSRRLLVWIGLLVTALGIVAVTAILHPSVPAFFASFAWGLAGLGMGLAYSTLSLVVLESVQPGQEGEATGGLQLLNVLGSALGTGVGGAFIARVDVQQGPAGGILLQNLLMAGMLGLAVLVARRLPYHLPKASSGSNSSEASQ
jgi:MFS family permease